MLHLHEGDTIFIHWKCAPAGLAKVVKCYDNDHVMLETDDGELSVVEKSRCIPVYTRSKRQDMLRIWNAQAAVMAGLATYHFLGMVKAEVSKETSPEVVKLASEMLVALGAKPLDVITH